MGRKRALRHRISGGLLLHREDAGRKTLDAEDQIAWFAAPPNPRSRSDSLGEREREKRAMPVWDQELTAGRLTSKRALHCSSSRH
jgi:hypothetical protein